MRLYERVGIDKFNRIFYDEIKSEELQYERCDKKSSLGFDSTPLGTYHIPNRIPNSEHEKNLKFETENILTRPKKEAV